MNTPRLCLAALAAGLLAGCSPKYYAPNTHNIPMLRDKGDVSVVLATGRDIGEVQAAYAVTRHIGVMMNSAFAGQEDSTDGDGGRGDFVEFGLGFFGSQGRLRYEAYGLVGGGSIENHFPSTLQANPGTTGIIESNFGRVSAQAAVGLSWRRAEVIASARLSSLKYDDINGSLVFAGVDQVVYLTNADRHTLIEPALTFRVGGDKIKFQFQTGDSYNLTTTDFRQDFDFASIGLVLYPSR